MIMSMKKILQATILTRLVLGVMILVGMEMMICLAMKMVLELKKGAKLSMMMNKANMKMININMKKHLEKMSFLKVLDLQVILITAMLHLMLVELLIMAMVLLKKKLLPGMLMEIIRHHRSTKIKAVQLMKAMEPLLELQLKVTIQPQELLRKSTVLLVSMRGARIAFLLLLWKEDKDLELEQLQRMMKTPKCVLEGPWISVFLCVQVSLPGGTGHVCRAVQTGVWSEEQQTLS